MEKGPWRAIFMSASATVIVTLVVYYAFGFGKKSSPLRRDLEERKEQAATGETFSQPGPPSAGAPGSPVRAASPSPQNTKEAEERLAHIKADIEASLLQLKAIGVRETELEQFAKPRLDALSLPQAVKMEEDRARNIKAFVIAAETRKEKLRGRIEAMLRKSQSESQLQRFTPRPDASLRELEALSAELEESTVKAMRE